MANFAFDFPEPIIDESVLFLTLKHNDFLLIMLISSFLSVIVSLPLQFCQNVENYSDF